MRWTKLNEGFLLSIFVCNNALKMTWHICSTKPVVIFIQLQKPCVTIVRKFFSLSTLVSLHPSNSFAFFHCSRNIFRMLFWMIFLRCISMYEVRRFFNRFCWISNLSCFNYRWRTMPCRGVPYEQERGPFLCQLCKHMAPKVCTSYFGNNSVL